MTRSGPRIAVVIPTLDEASNIAACVAAAGDADCVVVADGGSLDATRLIAEAAGARVIDAARGRARQLNAGARHADADVLVFVHADTTLPVGWRDEVLRVIGADDTVAGAFRFGVRGERVRDRIVSALGDARSRVTRHPYGDQALFVRRADFERAGGFPDQPVMEDWELVARLRALGRIGIARTAALTSSRQWDEGGLVRSTARYAWLIAAYRMGVPAERLAQRLGPGMSGAHAPEEA